MLNQYRPDTLPVVAVVVVRVDIARIEVEFATVVGIARIERTRPVVAVRACIVERRIIAIARRRQKSTSVSAVI